MNSIPKFAIASFLALSLFATSSCANMSDGTRTVAQGGIAGALLGGGLGYLVGGEEGALVGALAGGAVGAAYGSSVARKKAAYASEEKWLDDCIASANQDYNNAVAYNSSLENDVSSLKIQVAQARSSSEKTAAKRQVAAKIKATDKQLASIQQQVQDYNYGAQQAGGGAKAGQLRRTVSQFESTERSIQTQKNYLASLQNQIDA